jgi:hypothetical protein
MSKLVLRNEFGEQVTTAETKQEIANTLPAKAGVTSIAAIATANVPTAAAEYTQAEVEEMVVLINELKAKVNALIAALKVVS